MKPYSKFTFLSAISTEEKAKVIIIGFPYELTTSIPGTTFAPNRIREASWLIEPYSSYQKKSLTNIPISDMGNLMLPPVEIEKVSSSVEKFISPLISKDKKFLILGGDHSITYFLTKNLPPGIKILQLDAHLDSRNSWRGSSFNHATVMRRLKEEGREIFHVGIRSVADEEKGIPYFTLKESLNLLKKKDKAYLSVDIDIFDPSIAPAVSNPEPGGISFSEFLEWLKNLPPFELVGFDLVEFNPLLEGAHITSVLGATVIREIILKFWSEKEASL